MEVREVQFDLEGAVESTRGDSRSEGLHISDVIREIALASGELKPEYADSKLDYVKVSVGNAWEEWISRFLPEVDFHPGEIELDGTPMSPDGIGWEEVEPSGVDYDGPTPVVYEFKVTWKSSNRDITSEFMWMSQVKGYCLAVGTNRAVLIILYINGDYRQSGPQLKQFNFTFTDLELQENWEMISRYRNKIHGKGAKNDIKQLKGGGVRAAQGVPNKASSGGVGRPRQNRKDGFRPKNARTGRHTKLR